MAGGEDEILEPCRLEFIVMRGRRRRNKASSPDSEERGSGVDTEVIGSGAVRLVSPTSVEDAPDDDPAPSLEENPQSEHEGSRLPPTSPSRQTAPNGASGPGPEDPGGGGGWDRTRTEEIPAVTVIEASLRATAPPPSAEPDEAATATSVITETEPDPPVATVPPPAPEEVAEPAPEALAAERVEDGPAAQAAAGNPLPRVIAVANQKGGVGKTTTSVNLGAALAELGFRVLVVDLDPQGNATTGLGIDARHFEQSMYDVLMRDTSLEDCVEPTALKNLFVAPATIALAGAEIELVPAFSRELKLRRAIESVIEEFDYILIDCPPSLGLITVNALAAASEVLVPIQCEYYALEGLSQLTRNVHLVASNLNPKLDISTIVLTMYDARTKLADEVASDVRVHFGTKVCRVVIPRTVRLSEAPSFGQPITAFDSSSRGAVAYRELAKEVSGGTS
jgi:chromosome partitioning protein